MPFIESKQEFDEQRCEADSSSSRRMGFASTALEYFAEFTKIFIIAAAIILPIRLFLVQPFYVRGQSMEPNFHDNEYLIIDKLTPRFEVYQRGEVVVFRRDGRYLIKRVIGLPGEKVIISDQRITIQNSEHPDGFILDEGMYQPNELPIEFVTYEISNDAYFLLGDNRSNSYDSSKFGPIQQASIIGRVMMRGLPVEKFKIFSAPEYPTK